MAANKPDPTPIDAFLAPLVRIARKWPEIEGVVFWGGEAGWPDQPSEALEAEEIAYYAEGLLLDGFHLDWALLAMPSAPGLPDHLRLSFWQDGPNPPDPATGWIVLEGGRWTPPS